MKNPEILGEEGIQPKAENPFFLMASIALFAIMLAASAFLFFENRNLDQSIEGLQNEIVEYDRSIAKLGTDKKTIAAELVKLNKPSIQASIALSEAQKYIAEIDRISKDSGVLFSGFSYASGKVSTSATARAETVVLGDDGVKKVSKLIKTYRDSFTGSVFGLEPVLSIAGDEQKRTFSVEFTVATPTIQ